MADLALITGASSGLGEDFARIHARRGGDLVLVARREERLRVLADELQREHGVKVLVFPRDLSQPGAGRSLLEDLKEHQIEILINNAGFGAHGLFAEQEWGNIEDMLRLNVETLTALAHGVLPGMIERASGSILNVASMAGFLPGPLQAVYYATKAYVLSFSEALANEVSDAGITVSALCPGATETEFFDRAGMEGVVALKLGVASSRKVAEFGYKSLLKGRTVAVPGFANRFMMHSLRLTPRWLATRVSRAVMERRG